MAFEQRIRKELERLKKASLYRSRQITRGPQDITIDIGGHKLLNFSSNDYLGLANHPKVAEAFQAGIKRYGSGSGSAHLVSGHSHAHHALEEELAEFTGYPRALLFSSGYMANLGCISALLGRSDHALQDRLNHASLLDAGLLSRARQQRYLHKDLADLDKRLCTIENGEKLIISDGVFSMDGDSADVGQLRLLAQKHKAGLMIDDAHGLGVLGPHGEGSTEGYSHPEMILMGTLGKAFGSSGAFVAGSEIFIEYLIQKARPYIYTTAMPAALAEASRAALKLVKQADDRRQKLHQLGQLLRTELALRLPDIQMPVSQTAIQPLITGDAESAVSLSRKLREKGILVSAIRPPTVPEGTARLRITLSANHQNQHIEQLIDALAASR